MAVDWHNTQLPSRVCLFVGNYTTCRLSEARLQAQDIRLQPACLQRLAGLNHQVMQAVQSKLSLTSVNHLQHVVRRLEDLFELLSQVKVIDYSEKN